MDFFVQRIVKENMKRRCLHTAVLVPDGTIGIVRVLVFSALLVVCIIIGSVRLGRSVRSLAGVPRSAGLPGWQGRSALRQLRLLLSFPPGHQPGLLAFSSPALASYWVLAGAEIHSRYGPGRQTVNEISPPSVTSPGLFL